MENNENQDVYSRMNTLQLSIILDNAIGNVNWLLKHKLQMEELRHAVWAMKVRIAELEKENTQLNNDLKITREWAGLPPLKKESK